MEQIDKNSEIVRLLKYSLYNLAVRYGDSKFIISTKSDKLYLHVANFNGDMSMMVDELKTLSNDIQVIMVDDSIPNLNTLVTIIKETCNVIDIISINHHNVGSDFVSFYNNTINTLKSLNSGNNIVLPEFSEKIDELKDYIDAYINNEKTYLDVKLKTKKDFTMQYFKNDLPKISKGLAYSIKEFCTRNLIDFNVVLQNGTPLQRPFTWDLQQKQSLILSILKGRFISNVTVVQHFTKEDEIIFKIIDGKQRISTLCEFMRNEFKIVIDGHGYYYCELPEDVHLFFNRQTLNVDIAYEHYDKLISDKQYVSWFDTINFVGTRVQQEHLETLKNSLKLSNITSVNKANPIDINLVYNKLLKELRSSFLYDNTNPVRFYSKVAVEDRVDSIDQIVNLVVGQELAKEIYEDVAVSNISGGNNNNSEVESFLLDFVKLDYKLDLSVAYKTDKESGLMSIISIKLKEL